ncbi:TetR/AcrR family transcriptional regulator [Streptomyces sp. NPDC004542]|uniref:TetR/AcrR family transcriptional regulator n=1 Tax=Streptomyces sp. NPDC004542 TaxID=3154281 RepID=UPI0033AF01DD
MMTSNSTGRAGSPLARRRDSAVTRRDILQAAGRRFARANYRDVTLQEIADDVGITPAMIVRYFKSKRGLFREVARGYEFKVFEPTDPRLAAEGLARSLMEFWQDEDARWPAMALIRSPDMEDAVPLLRGELDRRLLGVWRETVVTGVDVEVRLRLLAALSMGLGLFGLDLFFDPDAPVLDAADAESAAGYLAAMLDVCLDHPAAG